MAYRTLPVPRVRWAVPSVQSGATRPLPVLEAQPGRWVGGVEHSFKIAAVCADFHRHESVTPALRGVPWPTQCGPVGFSDP